TKTNGQRIVSGNFITIAMKRMTKNAPSKTQAVRRMIQGGGSCGNISDSSSIESRCVVGLIIVDLSSHAELLAGEVIIKAALRDELVVRSNFRDASFLKHHDGIRFPDRAQTVRDDDRCSPGHQTPEIFLDRSLRFG